MNRTYLAIELRRIVRNKRAMFLYVAVPPVLFLALGRDIPAGPTADGVSPAASALVSLALYGALMTAATGGASVAVERAQGWTRQLRVTPLRPPSYVVTKVAAAMTVGALSVGLTLAVGAASGVRMPVAAWVGCALIAWLSSAAFAAFGLLMGYLLPAEWVIQVLGPMTLLLGLAGGLFFPVGDGVLADYARVGPVYGAAALTRAPLGMDLDGWAIVNLAAWTALFVALAAWRYRRTTERM